MILTTLQRLFSSFFLIILSSSLWYIFAKDTASSDLHIGRNIVKAVNLFPVVETCDDGLLNGEETGVDCGGSLCPPCQTIPDESCNPLYIVDNNFSRIESLDKGGTFSSVIVETEVVQPVLIALNHTNMNLYIYDRGDLTIKTSSLDGMNVQTLISGGIGDIGGIAIDEVNNRVFWTDLIKNEIESSDLNGSNRQTLVQNLNNPGGIVYDNASDRIYWTEGDGGSIKRSSADGNNVITLINGLAYPRGIDLDLTNGKIYFTDSGSKKIQRANMDGSLVEDVSNIGLTSPLSLKLDENNNKIYCTEWGQLKVLRMNLDGTGLQSLVNSGVSLPNSIVTNTTDQEILWVDLGFDRIQKSALDGSNVQNIFSSLSSFGIASDVAGDKIYWSNQSNGTINSSFADGSDQKVLIMGLDNPKGVAIHEESGKIFWVDAGSDKLQSANLDGTGIIDIVTTGLKIPNGVYLDKWQEYIYWSDFGNKTIERVKFDGSGREIVMNADDGLVIPEVIVVDGYNQKLYWADVGTSKIKSANLDGTDIQTIVANGLGLPKGMVLDEFFEKLYWTDAGKDRIERIGIDGSSRKIVYDLPGGAYPTAIGSPENICYSVSPGVQGQCLELGHLYIGNKNNNEWHKIADGQGEITAFINPRGNDLGHVTAHVYLDMDNVRYIDGVPYARRDIEILAENAPAIPISVRLFYTNDEINDLIASAEGISSKEDLLIARKDENCSGVYTGGGDMIPKLKSRIYGENDSYFEILSDQLGTFFLVGASSLLAVDLNVIDAKAEAEGIRIKWSTVSEIGSSHFVIQKSSESTSFSDLTSVKAKGGKNIQSSYEYLDRNPTPGVNYYRIVEKSLNNEESISEIVNEVWRNHSNAIRLFPVPARDKLFLQGGSSQGGKTKFFIFDSAGRLMKELTLNDSDSEISIHNLESGVYFARMIDYSGHISTQKITVIK